jgi:predicted HAD superfamily phosphohydrolase YqeG
MNEKVTKDTVVQKVAKSPILASLTTMLAVVPVLITTIYFISDVDSWLVSSDELTAAKIEIVNELRTESANIRVILLNDLEDRLTEIEIQMEELEAAGKPISSSLRRKAKTLHRRVQKITKGS